MLVGTGKPPAWHLHPVPQHAPAVQKRVPSRPPASIRGALNMGPFPNDATDHHPRTTSGASPGVPSLASTVFHHHHRGASPPRARQVRPGPLLRPAQEPPQRRPSPWPPSSRLRWPKASRTRPCASATPPAGKQARSSARPCGGNGPSGARPHGRGEDTLITHVNERMPLQACTCCTCTCGCNRTGNARCRALTCSRRTCAA